jgi:dihydrofolate synthase / folylpolyglutamate synthase
MSHQSSSHPQTLTQWLTYLDSLPSGLSVVDPVYLNHLETHLAKLKSLALEIQLLPFSCPVIVVGGTNGKGSCVAFLENILLAAGYTTGAYISPHLLTYNERVRVNGEAVSDESLCDAFAATEKAHRDHLDMSLSYFEFGTLAAFHIFKKQNPDVLILEVGLGGRLDAVNIVDADIAIITTIALDHTQLLGDNREDIGREKAGIMRALKPIICGDPLPPKSIYAAANEQKAILYCQGQDFIYTQSDDGWHWQFGDIKFSKLPMPHLPMQNAATALMAIHLLKEQGITIPEEAIAQGLHRAALLGRMQQVKFKDKNIILDVAHNPESAALLAKSLRAIPCQGKTLAVMSMLQDKDIMSSLAPFDNAINQWYLGKLDNPRAASLEQLANCLKELNVEPTKVHSFTDIRTAFSQALRDAANKDRILVFGSFYTVGSVLEILG